MSPEKTSPATPQTFPPFLAGASLLGQEELRELKEVISEKSCFRHYGLGHPHKVSDFEQYVRGYLGTRCALAVSSGSAALFCALAAIGAGPGDEIILPAFSWYSDYCCIVNAGARPVFADIDETLSIDPSDLARKITRRTKAVIVVHYQGGPAELEPILTLARENNLKVIEDCAQAFGGTYHGQKLGTFGDIGIASFQNNKIITCGEGGLLYTDNEEYYARAVRYHDLGSVRETFRNHLQNKRLADPERAFAGLQFRMSELQGAVILAQARKIDAILQRCRASHQRIRAHFDNCVRFRIRCVDAGDCGITAILIFPRAEEALTVRMALQDDGLPVQASSACCNLLEQYPIISRQMAFPGMPPFGGAGPEPDPDCPNDCARTRDLLNRIVALPIGPLYTSRHVDALIAGLEKALGKLAADQAR